MDLQGERPESGALAVLPPEGGLRSQQILLDIYLSLLFKIELFFTYSPQLRLDGPHTKAQRNESNTGLDKRELLCQLSLTCPFITASQWGVEEGRAGGTLVLLKTNTIRPGGQTVSTLKTHTGGRRLTMQRLRSHKRKHLRDVTRIQDGKKIGGRGKK